MTDIRISPYQGDPVSVFTTELNTLADDTWIALSAEFDNSTNGYMFADFEVVTANPSTGWGAGGASEIYLVPSHDGTNYGTWQGSGTADDPENLQYFVGSVSNQGAGTTGYTAVLRGVELPAGKFKIGFRNKNGDALASSGNTVKLRYWTYKSA